MTGPSTPAAYRIPPIAALVALIVGLTLLRFWVGARLGLGDAEAYYWTWSRHLAPGYLDHGPAVAILIRLGTWTLGDTPLGVRCCFILISSATLALTGLLAVRLGRALPDATHDPRVGLRAVVALVAMPIFLVAGGAATPDAPFLALALLQLAALLRLQAKAPRTDPAGWLAAAGLCLGLSLCAKLLGLLLLPALLHGAWRQRRRAWSLVIALGAAALGALPVLLWNASHGWPSLHYHLVSRHSQTVGPSLANLGKLLGGQLAYYSPFVLSGLALALVALWRRRSAPLPALLLWTALPVLLGAFLLILIVPGAEPHWPAVGYLPCLLALAAWLPGWREHRPVLARRLTRAGVIFAALFGLALHLHVLTTLGLRLMPRSYVPRFDLSNELHGWPQVADRVTAELRRRDPAGIRVAGCHYTVCAQLAFAARGRFDVVCPSPRLDQFDFFPGGDGATLRGIDLLYVRDERFPFDADRLYRCAAGTASLAAVDVERGGRVVRHFALQLCRGFQGLRAKSWPPADPAEAARRRRL